MYRNFFDFTPIGYLDINFDHKIRDVNLTAVALFQEDKSKIIGLPLSSFVSQEDQDQIFLFLRKLLNKNQHVSIRLQMRSLGGKLFHARLTSWKCLMG